jgi:hypothetical protein
MGTGTFFSKIASVDPLAQALHLPGASKYAQLEQSQNAGTSAANGGPYSGATPTLASAAGGYVPGGVGANTAWAPWTPTRPGGLFGGAQRFSAAVGQTTPNPLGGNNTPSNLGQIVGTATGNGASNAAGMGYVQATRNALAQQQQPSSTYGSASY